MIDQYQTVINDITTFDGIANHLKTERSIIFAWTDGHSTQYDILMCLKPLQVGYMQRGMKSATDLFVAISSLGMFGFKIDKNWKSPAYIGEKLGIGGHSATTAELAELINGVIDRL